MLKAAQIRDEVNVLDSVDPGLKRADTLALDWGDVDKKSGMVKIAMGKGKSEQRTCRISKIRRELLGVHSYRCAV